MKRLSPGVITILTMLVVCMVSSSAYASDAGVAVLPGYSYVKDHVIDGSPASSLSDYQMIFLVHRGEGIDTGQEVYLNGHSQSWPYDIRFSDPGGNLLNYWLESSDADTAVVWVKVGSIPQSPAITSIRLYYGKAGDSGSSDGLKTFLFFDDFSSGDSLKWDIWGSPVFADGFVHLSTAGDFVKSVTAFDPGTTALRAKISTGIPSDYFSCFGYGGYQSSGGWNYLDQNGAYVWFEYGEIHNIRWFIGGNIVTTGVPLNSDDTWHTYDVYTDPDRINVTINMDGTPVLSGRGKTGTGSPKQVFFGRHNLANGSADVKADWILLRKHTTSEPVHSYWGSEQRQDIPVATATSLLNIILTPTATPAPTTASLAGYSSVKTHEIVGSPDGYLSDYQLKFVIHRGTGIDSGQDVYLDSGSQSWPNDIRFTTSDGTSLSYWLESANAESAVVWVKIPAIPSSGTAVKLLYGKAGDGGASDGDGTFEFFSDFNDLSEFNTLGTVYLTDSIATIRPGERSWNQIASRQTFPDNRRIRCSLKSAHDGLVPELYEIFFSAAGAPADMITWPSYEQANYGDAQQYYASRYEWNTGGQSTGTVGLLGWSAGEYHTQELIRHSQATWLVDDGNRVDCGPDKYDFGPQHVGIKVFGDNGRVDVDWLFVSKYTEHEPGHGTWSPTGQLAWTLTPTPEPYPVEVSPGPTEISNPTVTPAPSPSVATPLPTATPAPSMAMPTPITSASPLPVKPITTPVKTQSGLSQLIPLILWAIAIFVIICMIMLALLILIVVIDQRINK